MWAGTILHLPSGSWLQIIELDLLSYIVSGAEPGAEWCLVQGGGFEPPQGNPLDLQSSAIGHSATPGYR